VRRKRTFYTVLDVWIALSLMWFTIDLFDDSSSLGFYWPMLGTGIGLAITGTMLLGVGGCSAPSGSARMAVRRIVPVFDSPAPGDSRDFYAEVLGLEVAMDLDWVVTFAPPGDPASQLAGMSHDATAPLTPDASVEVDDVDAAYRASAAQRVHGHVQRKRQRHHRALGVA